MSWLDQHCSDDDGCGDGEDDEDDEAASVSWLDYLCSDGDGLPAYSHHAGV